MEAAFQLLLGLDSATGPDRPVGAGDASRDRRRRDFLVAVPHRLGCGRQDGKIVGSRAGGSAGNGSRPRHATRWRKGFAFHHVEAGGICIGHGMERPFGGPLVAEWRGRSSALHAGLRIGRCKRQRTGSKDATGRFQERRLGGVRERPKGCGPVDLRRQRPSGVSSGHRLGAATGDLRRLEARGL